MQLLKSKGEKHYPYLTAVAAEKKNNILHWTQTTQLTL